MFYFDALGCSGENKPTEYIRQFLQHWWTLDHTTTMDIYFNTCPIQSSQSVSCGLFCALFVQRVATVGDYISFMQMFKHDDLISNDAIVENLLFGK